MNVKILVVEDDSSLRSILIEAISLKGFRPIGVASAEEAVKRFNEETFDIVLTDLNLPGKNGLDLIPLCLQHNPNVYLLLMTAFGTIDVAVKAMKLGAADFFCKPIALNDLLNAIEVAIDKISGSPEKPATSSFQSSPIIAKSTIMLNLLKEVETISPYKINALIVGETGTGKELIARLIHESSPRAKKPFVPLNCAAIPENLLEDELFGHIKGAYTGAQNDRQGRFEQADGGTLFLDEIGDMNLALQAKLLRVLQEHEFEKLGSTKTIKVDVRVIAATSADLDKKILDGSFRADLYHRLNVVNLKVPPLRERPDDILPIAQGLLERFCKTANLPSKTVSDEAIHSLVSYEFPGNVRQLQNAMERAAVFSGANSQILLKHLPEELTQQANLFQTASPANFMPEIPEQGIDFSNVVSQIERDLLLQTLEKTGGNKMQAAKLLNMKRTTLVEKIKRLQIESEEDEETEVSEFKRMAG